MKYKISKLQIFRHIIQIAFFVLLPSLYFLAFSQLKTIYIMILKGNYNFIQAFPQIFVAVVIFPITIYFGRFFCGWFCAFGSFNDFLYMISSKVFRTKFKITKRLDVGLKYFKYVVLVFVICVIWTKGNTLFDSTSPWDAFALITDFPSVISDYFIGFVLLGLITVGAIYIERFFCRYLCPLGAFFAITSKLRRIKVVKPTEKCGKCRVCTNNCAMGINLYKTEQVSSGECINCFKCIEVCPRANTKVIIKDENIDPVYASSMAIVAFVGFYVVSSGIGNIISKNNADLGNRTSNSKAPSTSSSNATTNKSAPPVSSFNSKYKDGTYTGSGTGFRPNLTVAVSIRNDRITKVEVVSINDNEQQPVSIVPQEIIQAQSTNVDAVSGATRTSNGIMNAVDDALSKAMA